jgi:hypothetical protein
MAEYELSYLIRMGAGKHPQCKGAYWFGLLGGVGLDGVEATCAIGAAGVALASLTGLDLLKATMIAHDALNVGTSVDVMTLNDDLGLTREDIADQLDALPGGSPVVRV